MKETSKLTESELFQLLMNNPGLFEDILAAYNVRVKLEQLDPEIDGFIYKGPKDTYFIVINQDLDGPHRLFVFIHELYHLICELSEQKIILRLARNAKEKFADREARMICRQNQSYKVAEGTTKYCAY
ncbi:ImmA/IrrE family metallo-endopeptidase [Carboxydothermus pertinax]|uniref:IrrE N-terminal-like domain-containing protein n=1 Tax=Carboxydothermus pertinax TaxID=870242 RepID=A0A1L8CRM0_9THEO|nr:ImmA/IrrE family metallo-endopeptidase [Carboxydothermus pertinax]GAV21568.1 hypothetical protein cpu_00780 [Carboxydothermus pertinax]